MTDPAALAAASAAPAAALAPVAEQERIVTLDILRGIALLGVVVANVWLWFSGIAFRGLAYRDELMKVSLDSIVFMAIAVLVSGKAISTFSFLFGHGFAVQMLRAEARGRSVVPTYLRRLGVLLIIGLAHMTLLWYGDILTAYALLGFILVLFRKRADRTLLIWAAILIIAVPTLLGAIPMIMSALGVEMPTPDLAAIDARHAATLAVFQSTDYGAIVRENLVQAGKFFFGRKSVFLLYLLGLFLLGLYVGRRRMFQNVSAHRALLRRLVIWGIPIGLIAGIVLAVMQVGFEPGEIMAKPWLALVFTVLSMLSMPPLAAGYVAAVTLLLEKPQWADRLSIFAPVGRMALTNYLLQTVILVSIVNGYGLGMIGHIGPAFGLVMALTLYSLQMIWSPIWLNHFRFGPMEWLWRSLTYGTPQPMRIRHPAAGMVGTTG
jgi:uncharacterized protein